MRIDPDGTIVLSRRNLLVLLAKLDGHPANSACTLIGGEDAPGLRVKAESDEAHYASRWYAPGEMAPETESAI